MRAVGELARAHAPQEVEVLGDAAIAVRAVDAGLGQRAAGRAHFLGRLAVDVGQALLDEPFREPVQVVVVVGRVVAVPAPVVAQPSHRVGDRVLELDLLLQRIGVVVAKVAGAVVLGGEPEVEDDRLGVTVVQVAVGLGRKARDDAPVVLAGAQVLAMMVRRKLGAGARPAARRRGVAARGCRVRRFAAVQHSFRFCS